MCLSKVCCKVEGCSNPSRSKGYCQKHYAQEVRKGNIIQTKRKTENKIVLNENENVAYLYTENSNGEINGTYLIDIDMVEKIKKYR